jgi:ribose transport system substrate-binding protein
MNGLMSRSALRALLLAAAFTVSATLGAAQAADPDAELAALNGKVLSTGPNGEAPSPASVVTLSDDDIAKVKGMHATAAIVLHYGGNDWSRAQVEGQKAEFAALGIDVVAVTDAGFKPETQVNDIETVLAKKPSIIISIPVDPVSEAGAYRKAADAGVKLVFMDNVPKGLVAGKDYVSVVSADNYGNGVAAGLLMAKFLNGKGNIGAVFHAADFFVTKQRYQGFQKAISEFPGIKIIEAQGIAGPDFSGDADKVASAMITAHPNIDGIWAVWDVPAEGVISAARSAGDAKLVITTEDLGENVAINMAQGGYVKGLGAQRPYDQGVTEVKLAAYGLLGKKAPDYVALPSLAVTKSNLLDAWKAVYHTDAPADVKDSMK